MVDKREKTRKEKLRKKTREQIAKETAKNAVIYARVSTEEQKKGPSLSIQEEEAQTWAKNNGYTVKNTFKDHASARLPWDQRPILQEAIQEAEKCNGVLILHTITRLCRSFGAFSKIYEELATRNIGLVILSLQGPLYASKYEGGNIITAAVLSMGSEKKNYSERTAQSLQQRKREGKQYCATPPLGYRVGKNGGFVIDREQQKTVNRIFQLMAEEDNLSRAARILNEEGYKGATGKKFYPSTVKMVFENEIHAKNKAKYYDNSKKEEKNG